MPIIDHAALLDVDADRAWAVLRRFGAIAEWHPAISSSKIENGVADGAPGAIRCLTLADGSMLRECLLALDDANRSFTYRFEEAALPVDDYHLTVTLIPLTGKPQTFIRWTARFDVRAGNDVATQVETIRSLIAGGHDALSAFLIQGLIP
ncbi:SRPBCC family protein [Roseomonas gilardii]|uniref:SRPBCC family protein n=1 Tax=Roseomonas gilardii TaxID=257708 RepID=UPI000485BA2E|nr:SRPBCC family protein [Roseomonas gilardii]